MIQTVDNRGRVCVRARTGDQAWACFYPDQFVADAHGWRWQLRRGSKRRPNRTHNQLSWHLLDSNRNHRGRPTEPLTRLILVEGDDGQ
jgi:hypothetical protein